MNSSVKEILEERLAVTSDSPHDWALTWIKMIH